MTFMSHTAYDNAISNHPLYNIFFLMLSSFHVHVYGNKNNIWSVISFNSAILFPVLPMSPERDVPDSLSLNSESGMCEKHADHNLGNFPNGIIPKWHKNGNFSQMA